MVVQVGLEALKRWWQMLPVHQRLRRLLLQTSRRILLMELQKLLLQEQHLVAFALVSEVQSQHQTYQRAELSLVRPTPELKLELPK